MRKKRLLKISYHRNGVTAEGFWVVIFNSYEGNKKNRMLGIQFDNDTKEIYTAILDIDLLNKGIIEFGKNSWRGDYYNKYIRNWIKERREDEKSY